MVGMRTLTDEQENEVGRLYKAGATLREVADRFAVSTGPIVRALKRLGIERRPSRANLRRITETGIAEAVRRYKAGEMLQAIADDLGIKRTMLYYHFGRLSVQMRPNGFDSRALTPEQDREVAERYAAGESAKDLAIEFGTTGPSIAKAARRAGGQIRSVKQAHRQYGLNELAFRKRSGETDYWVGMLMADGAIVDREAASTSVCLDLKSEDRTHLEKLSRFLAYEGPIFDDNRGCSSLKVRSDALAADLASWGMAERKSLEEDPHPALLQSADFWRGQIDGDGSVYLTVGNFPGQWIPAIATVGGQRIVTAFADWVKTFAKTRANPHDKGNGLWAFALKCGPAVDAIRRLYADCDPMLALDRKLNRAQAILARWPNGYNGPATEPLW